MRQLITYVPDAWPWLSSILALGLPRLIRELGRIYHSRTVRHLADAAIEHQEWSDKRFEQVVRLVHDEYPQPGQPRWALKRQPPPDDP